MDYPRSDSLPFSKESHLTKFVKSILRFIWGKYVTLLRLCEGVVDRSTEDLESEGGSYIQVRVTLDVFQILCQGRIIKLDEGEKIWVNFRYERLLNIYYWCGCLNHGDKECVL